MKNEDVKVGLKVIPHSKSLWGNLESSTMWQRAKNTSGFLYVVGYSEGEDAWILSDSLCLNFLDGDYFLAGDFELFNVDLDKDVRFLKFHIEQTGKWIESWMYNPEIPYWLVEQAEVFCNMSKNYIRGK